MMIRRRIWKFKVYGEKVWKKRINKILKIQNLSDLRKREGPKIWAEH